MEPITTAAIATKVASDVAEVAKESSKSFLTAVLREPGEALGGLLGDAIRARRYANLIKITARSQERLKAAGLTPKEVPLSIIHPALEAASLEEDPDLQALWANLLASAADPTSSTAHASPSYLAVLRELSTSEVKLLNAWYDAFVAHFPDALMPSRAHITDRRFTIEEVLPIYSDAALSQKPWPEPLTVAGRNADPMAFRKDFENLSVVLAVLVRHSLVRKIVDEPSIGVNGEFVPSNEISYALTDFGVMFIAACRGSETVA